MFKSKYLLPLFIIIFELTYRYASCISDFSGIKKSFITASSNILLVILTSFWTFQLIKCEQKRKKLEKNKEYFLSFIKENFKKMVENKYNIKLTELNIRVFVNKGKNKFNILNLPFLIEEAFTKTEKLYFKADKNRPQGLVGRSAVNKECCYCLDFKSSNEDYHLNDFQISCVEHLSFAFCCPIIEQGGEVKAVICIDSSKESLHDLDQNAVDEFKKDFRFFAKVVYNVL